MPEVDPSLEVKVEKVMRATQEEDETVEGKVEEEVELGFVVEGEDSMTEADGWMDLLGSGDLKKKVIKEGLVESRAERGSVVVLNATGQLLDGTEVDQHDGLTFTLGDNEVIQGLELVAPLMDKGEVAKVYMAARFAYGSRGLPPSIPPDSALTYKVELVDFGPEEEPSSLPLAERMAVGNRKRERGNWWFNREEYSLAIQCYSSAIDFLDDAEEEYGEEVRPEVDAILRERLKALNNMGAAQMKIEAYDMALRSFDAVLKCQPNNVKALFRKGKVLGIQGNMKDSIVLLKTALELEPESRVIHQELARMREKARAEAESEKSLYRRMLGLKKGAAQPDTRYPHIEHFPWRTWLTAFTLILMLLTAYHYRALFYSLVL